MSAFVQYSIPLAPVGTAVFFSYLPGVKWAAEPLSDRLLEAVTKP